MTVNGNQFDSQKLMPKSELLSFLRANGEDDRALADIRGYYYNFFGNELVWCYPISEGKHLGTFIVIVKEGFISLPYDSVDREDGELLALDDAAMFDAECMDFFIDDWKSFSNDLLNAMIDMRRILHSE